MDEADRLYAVPPEEFVAARNALAKELRSAGRRADAAVVAKLRRPTPAAWALDQVARTAPDLLEAALAAGAALREASDAVAAGGSADLRTATAEERAAATEVVRAAAEHLGRRADALRPVLLATLRAAALDDDVAAHLRRGTLAADVEQPGFGFGAEVGPTLSLVPPLEPSGPKAAASGKGKATGRQGTKAKATGAESKGAKGKGTSTQTARAEAKAEAAAAKAEKAAAEAAAEEARREKEAAKVRRAEERARRKELAARRERADRLERTAARLAREADQAEEEARSARAQADEAAAKAATARQEADELGAADD